MWNLCSQNWIQVFDCTDPFANYLSLSFLKTAVLCLLWPFKGPPLGELLFTNVLGIPSLSKLLRGLKHFLAKRAAIIDISSWRMIVFQDLSTNVLIGTSVFYDMGTTLTPLLYCSWGVWLPFRAVCQRRRRIETWKPSHSVTSITTEFWCLSYRVKPRDVVSTYLPLE